MLKNWEESILAQRSKLWHHSSLPCYGNPWKPLCVKSSTESSHDSRLEQKLGCAKLSSNPTQAMGTVAGTFLVEYAEELWAEHLVAEGESNGVSFNSHQIPRMSFLAG